MVQQKVQLRKVRDFGENLNDTFQFIRQEFKPLAGSFILFAGVFILAQSIIAGLFQGKMFAFLDDFKNGMYTKQPTDAYSAIFTPQYFLLIICSFLSIVAMRVTVACYMKLYDEKQASPTIREVWILFSRQYLKNVVFSIPVLLITIISIFFCFFPVVYFAIVFAPFQFIVVSEGVSFGDAFSRCFTLIKENFWISFGIYILTYIIYLTGSSIIGFFIGALIGIASYFTTNEISSTVGIVTSAVSAIAYLFYIIFFVSVGMHYYNLAERADGTGMARRLENLGKNTNPNENIEEQY